MTAAVAVPAAGVAGTAAVSLPRERLAYLDVARGISIVLVALYHSGLQPLLPQTMQALGLFRLPLFFFLSGLLFPAGRAPQAVALDKARTLLRPYAAVLLLLLLRSFWKGEADVPAVLAGIAWGNGGSIEWIPMWFLPHLWLVCVAAALWLRSGWAGWPPVAQGAAWAALLTLGTWWPVPERAFALTLFGRSLALPWLPFSADLLGISLAFLLLGVRTQARARAFTPQAGWLVVCVGVFLAIALGSDAAVNLNLRVYREPLLATLGALAGLYAVLCCSHALAGRTRGARRGLAYLGQASLFILVFHDHVDNKVQAWLGPRLGPGHEWAVALIAFAACLTVPLLIRAVVLRSRALAWLFGQRPLQNRLSAR